MIIQHLKALQHFDPEGFDIDGKFTKLSCQDQFQCNVHHFPDPKKYRNLVCWLENQKIRFYPVEKRSGLRKTDDEKLWEKSFQKYLSDSKCDTSLHKSQESQLIWLLGKAIRAAYQNSTKKSLKTVYARLLMKA